MVLLSSVLIVISAYSVFSQQNQYDKATPPQHAAGVSALGSYSSADLGNVNLSNGALNLKIPLGSVGGRGFSLPLTLNWSSKIGLVAQIQKPTAMVRPRQLFMQTLRDWMILLIFSNGLGQVGR